MEGIWKHIEQHNYLEYYNTECRASQVAQG